MILKNASARRFSLLLCFIFLTFLGVAGANPVAHYSHTNSKGRTYYLFKKETTLKNSKKVQTIYFFAKDSKNKKGTPLDAVPKDRVVHETKRGMLVLKKKESEKPNSME